MAGRSGRRVFSVSIRTSRPMRSYAAGVQAMSDLDRLESELDDVETALACLSRTEPGLCDPCTAANVEGTLVVRPGLWACAEGRLAGEGAAPPTPVTVEGADAEHAEPESVDPEELADADVAEVTDTHDAVGASVDADDQI